jgi:hypothetical protein
VHGDPAAALGKRTSLNTPGAAGPIHAHLYRCGVGERRAHADAAEAERMCESRCGLGPGVRVFESERGNLGHQNRPLDHVRLASAGIPPR